LGRDEDRFSNEQIVARVDDLFSASVAVQPAATHHFAREARARRAVLQLQSARTVRTPARLRARRWFGAIRVIADAGGVRRPARRSFSNEERIPFLCRVGRRVRAGRVR